MVPIFAEYITFHPHPGFSIIDQISCKSFEKFGQEDPNFRTKFGINETLAFGKPQGPSARP